MDLMSQFDEGHTDPGETTCEIIWAITKIAVPSFFTLLLAECIYQINVVMVSSLNNDVKIAAVGLAISLINTMPFAVIIGIATVLETLVG